MLVIREYRENEGREMKQLLLAEGINDLELDDYIYIVSEDDSIIGVCKIQTDNESGILKYLLIKESSRGENLGDGLLRAALSGLENKGIVKVYFDEINLYLLKKGFHENEQKKLELNLKEFFARGCKYSGETNEI